MVQPRLTQQLILAWPNLHVPMRIPSAPQKPEDRGSDNAIEQERPVDEQREADNLQPFEGFPPETEGDDPDEEGTAGVDGGAGGRGDGARDGQAEEIEPAEESP